jgi:hypothetical protein
MSAPDKKGKYLPSKLDRLVDESIIIHRPVIIRNAQGDGAAVSPWTVLRQIEEVIDLILTSETVGEIMKCIAPPDSSSTINRGLKSR